MPLKAPLKVPLKAPLEVSPPIVHPILCPRRGASGQPPPGAPQNGVLGLLKGRLKGYLKGSGGAPSMKVFWSNSHFLDMPPEQMVPILLSHTYVDMLADDDANQQEVTARFPCHSNR